MCWRANGSLGPLRQFVFFSFTPHAKGVSSKCSIHRTTPSKTSAYIHRNSMCSELNISIGKIVCDNKGGVQDAGTRIAFGARGAAATAFPACKQAYDPGHRVGWCPAGDRKPGGRFPGVRFQPDLLDRRRGTGAVRFERAESQESGAGAAAGGGGAHPLGGVG